MNQFTTERTRQDAGDGHGGTPATFPPAGLPPQAVDGQDGSGVVRATAARSSALTGPLQGGPGFISHVRAMAARSLARMYRPDERLFVFRVQRKRDGIAMQGLSRRYTAIALIGLAGEGKELSRSVLAGDHPHAPCGHLIGDMPQIQNLGDVALTVWAARAVAYPDRQWAWQRLMDLRPAEGIHPTVELAWSLTALCLDPEAPVGDLRERLARRLVEAFEPTSGMFPHTVCEKRKGLRWHVSCFADLVYPTQALAHYARLSGDPAALNVALRCGRRICELQGPAGQWWWHYDRRSGDVIEPYPVYAVHQDAMAPMALFALQDASGLDFTPEITRGLTWLANAPELDGGSLVDREADLIWRKVARREPRKLTRYIQAAASSLHPALRIPGLDLAFPPGAVDYEDRPYHLGWLLYAWPASRVAQWEARDPGR